MSRSHSNVVETGIIREKSAGSGVSIPSTIVSDLTLGTTQAIKTNNIQVADGSYITLYNSLVQPSGFIASPNITTDHINENTSGQGILVTANIGVTGTKKLSVNTIEPAPGSTGMAIGATGATITLNKTISDIVNVNGLLSTTYDMVCGNVLQTNTITERYTDDGVTCESDLIVQGYLTLEDTPGATNTTRVLTLDDDDTVTAVHPKYLQRPCINQFFDDFTGYVPSTFLSANRHLIAFDKPWELRGVGPNYPYQVVLDRGGEMQIPPYTMNGVVRVEAGYLYEDGDRFHCGLNNYSSFNVSNGDITFECVMSKPFTSREYYDGLDIFIGLGRDQTDGANVTDMSFYAGFYYTFTVSASPNNYWSTIYDIADSGFTRDVNTVQLMDDDERIYQLKMIIGASNIKYYINNTLVKTENVTFPENTILQPRIGYDVTRSDIDQSVGPSYGINMDYVFCSQDLNRSTI